jgi:hypothetical protein
MRRFLLARRSPGGLPPQPFPPEVPEASDSLTDHADAIGDQEVGLHGFVPAVAAKPPARTDYTMTRNGRIGAAAHDIADAARGERFSSETGDIAVGGHPPLRNVPDDGQHTCSERQCQGVRSNLTASSKARADREAEAK